MAKKNKKKSGAKFNIFDVLIILAVIACIGAIIVRAFFIDDNQESRNRATIRFTVENVSDVTAQAVCITGKTLYLQKDDMQVGTITEASASAQKIMAEDANGLLVEALHPDKKQVIGTANLTGTWIEDGFLIGGTYLATVGSTLDIYTEEVSCTITILSITDNS